LEGAELAGAHMQGADLSDACLQGADLSGADLEGANLKSAFMNASVLENAQLQGANLASTELQGATLWRAQLQAADLSGANLAGANLAGAQLQGSNLRNVDGSDTEFDATWVFGSETTGAQLDWSAILSVRPSSEIPFRKDSGHPSVQFRPMNRNDVDTWVDAARRFAPDENARRRVAQRFERLILSLQSRDKEDADKLVWNDRVQRFHQSDPTGVYHRSRTAILFGDLACNNETRPHPLRYLFSGCDPKPAPYVARAMVEHQGDRLGSLGEQLHDFLIRLEAGRENPKLCPVAAQLPNEYWNGFSEVEKALEDVRGANSLETTKP
jgi:hypothetical protein